MMELTITIFLCGDLMLGRGIDQILPHSVDPALHESFVKNAKAYVKLAQKAHGPIDAPVGVAYLWGEAMHQFQRFGPQLRIVNLETAITTSDDFCREKGIHYRMHPDNVPTLAVAKIDCCVLANNHVLDWGYTGLAETIDTLRQAGIATAGAGADADQAAAPAVLAAGNGKRVLLFAYALPSSGVPPSWGAGVNRQGVNYLPSLSKAATDDVIHTIRQHAGRDDLVILSIHWGGNWGYHIPDEQIRFAHRLIDDAGVDIVHGHSSHHVKGLEVYQGRLILYGCGDFITDYEGIRGHEQYRPDLALMYFPTIEATTGQLKQLHLSPMQVRQMQVTRAERQDALWLGELLHRESRRFGVRIQINDEGYLLATW